jgi:acyl-CoA synthetase (AMP-forming)/AMP-acid ligase II
MWPPSAFPTTSGVKRCRGSGPHARRDLTEATIFDWCRDRMAGYKRPKQVIFITPDQMPRTATGKILHRVLREAYADGEPVFPETDSCKARGKRARW